MDPRCHCTGAARSACGPRESPCRFEPALGDEPRSGLEAQSMRTKKLKARPATPATTLCGPGRSRPAGPGRHRRRRWLGRGGPAEHVIVEHLWSRAVAISGSRWQTRRLRERRIQAKTVATGCDQLPARRHGKEGVDGSSPSEGFTKAPQNGAFSFRWGGASPSVGVHGKRCGKASFRSPSPRRHAGACLRESSYGRRLRAPIQLVRLPDDGSGS
jgi:hypothetical protein